MNDLSIELFIDKCEDIGIYQAEFINPIRNCNYIQYRNLWHCMQLIIIKDKVEFYDKYKILSAQK